MATEQSSLLKRRRSNNTNRMSHNNNNNNNNNTGTDSSDVYNSYQSIEEADWEDQIEIPEEIYAIRKSALQVLKPLNKTWVVLSVGFSVSSCLAMAKYTGLLYLPILFIMLPVLLAHLGLLFLLLLSAKSLSQFIGAANENRQKANSNDQINRTEYLPLLQRSLKFGLKTALLSLCFFILEVLLFVRLSGGHQFRVSSCLFSIWILVILSILDGLICKSQHPVRVCCWILLFVGMTLLTSKVDHGADIRWRTVLLPIYTVLCIGILSLLYILYGHQIGFYRLTESQVTAGNLYCLAALIVIIELVILESILQNYHRPVQVETRLLLTVLTPLVVSLVGMGAWVVSRDEFGRLLLYGGQINVHPKQLVWEENGWNCINSQGVDVILFFGEVNYCPLESKHWLFPHRHAVPNPSSHPYLSVGNSNL